MANLTPSPEFVDWFFSDLAERQRVKELTVRDLILEAIEDLDIDEPLIEEMMNRICPGWDKLLNEPRGH